MYLNKTWCTISNLNFLYTHNTTYAIGSSLLLISFVFFYRPAISLLLFENSLIVLAITMTDVANFSISIDHKKSALNFSSERVPVLKRIKRSFSYHHYRECTYGLVVLSSANKLIFMNIDRVFAFLVKKLWLFTKVRMWCSFYMHIQPFCEIDPNIFLAEWVRQPCPLLGANFHTRETKIVLQKVYDWRRFYIDIKRAHNNFIISM